MISRAQTRMVLSALGFATIAAASPYSQAASIFGAGLNNMIYHNYENVFDSNGNQIASTVASPATLAVGDTIVGVLRIDQIQHSDGSADWSNINGVDEITGIFAQKITAIIGTTVYFDKATLTTFHNSTGGETVS